MPSKTPPTVPSAQRRAAPVVTVVQQNNLRSNGAGKTKKANPSPVGLPISSSTTPTPKDEAFNIDISNSNEFLEASSKYEQHSSSQLDDRSITTSASVIKVDAKLHKLVSGQRKEVAANLSTSPNISHGFMGHMSKNSSPIKGASTQSSPQHRMRGLSNLGSEDEDEEVSSLHLSERPPYHPRHHANSTNSNSNPITPARSHSPGPGAALSSSLQTSNSPPALQEMSDQNLMMAVALYQGELNRRLLQGNDVGGGALPQAPRDQIIQEFSELFRGMIGNGQPGQPYLSSETLQAMIHLHNEANESNDDTGTNEIFWQEHDEGSRASPDTVSTMTASTQYTDVTTAIHSQLPVSDQEASRDAQCPKRPQTHTRVCSAPSSRARTTAEQQSSSRIARASRPPSSSSHISSSTKPRSSSAGANLRMSTTGGGSRSSTPRRRPSNHKSGSFPHLTASLPTRPSTAGKNTNTSFSGIRPKGSSKSRTRPGQYHLEVDDAELSSIHSEDKGHNLNCNNTRHNPHRAHTHTHHRHISRQRAANELSQLPKYPNHLQIPQPGSCASDKMFASITSMMNTFFPSTAVAAADLASPAVVATKDTSDVVGPSVAAVTVEDADVTGRPMVIDLAAVTKSLASGKINFPVSPPGELNVIRSPKSAFDDRSVESNSTTSCSVPNGQLEHQYNEAPAQY